MRSTIRNRWFSGITAYVLAIQSTLFTAYPQDQTTPAKLSIVILEGEGAINNNRQRVAREPVIQVEDENHKPVAGAAVTFLMPNQGAGASFANGARSLTVLSDEKGQAIARGLKPNGINGNYQVRVNASFRGQTASSSINQSSAVSASPGTSGLSAKVLSIVGAAGAAAAVGIYLGTRGGSPTVLSPNGTSVGAPQ
jgi:hypothetical protein